MQIESICIGSFFHDFPLRQGCQAGAYPNHAYDQGCQIGYPECSGKTGVWEKSAKCCKPSPDGPDIEPGCECATDDHCPGTDMCGAADGTFMVGRPACTCYKCVRDRWPTGADTGCPRNAPVCTGPGIGVIPDCVGGITCLPPPGGDIPPTGGYCPPGEDLVKIKFDKDRDGNPTQAGQYVKKFPGFTVYLPLDKLGSGARRTTKPRIFDSNGSGSPDPDLRQNKGKVLIIQEDYTNDDSGDRRAPDDNEQGGQMNFKFLKRTKVKSIAVLDTEELTRLFFDDPTANPNIRMPRIGDGEFQVVDIDYDNVKEMMLNGKGSFAVAWIEICL